MSKARDLANLGSNTSSLATDSEVTAAVAPKANTTDVNTALSAKADASALTTHTSATSAHGVTGNIVGTDGVQSINNKGLYKSQLYGIVEWGNVSAYTLNATQLDLNIDQYPSVWLFTSNPTANWNLNLTVGTGSGINSFMSTGHVYTITLLVTNGSTAYYCNGLKVDGTSQTIKWQGGTAPSAGNASAIDAYTFTIMKTAANTYTVLGAVTKFA